MVLKASDYRLSDDKVCKKCKRKFIGTKRESKCMFCLDGLN